jgi:hypothetical protein
MFPVNLWVIIYFTDALWIVARKIKSIDKCDLGPYLYAIQSSRFTRREMLQETTSFVVIYFFYQRYGWMI